MQKNNLHCCGAAYIEKLVILFTEGIRHGGYARYE